MATLDPKPYPLPKIDFKKKDFREGSKAHDAAFEAIPKNQLIAFGVADGAAYYYVKSFKPLVLQHVPWGDAWQVQYALIRGLRVADVRRQLLG